MNTDLQKRGFFITGQPRSGTTLFSRLLDDHPDVHSFPFEYYYLNQKLSATCNLTPQLLASNTIGKLNEGDIRSAGTGSTGIYDKVRRSSFKRFVEKEWENNAQLYSGNLSKAGALSVIQGYNNVFGEKKHWAIKNPKYELFFKKLFSDFPSVKVIYLVRDPREVYVSRFIKVLKKNEKVSTRKERYCLDNFMYQFVKEWKDSVGIVMNTEYDILVVRYEDLLFNLCSTMKKVSDYLDIKYMPSMLIPTVMGSPWKSNTVRDGNNIIGNIVGTGKFTKYLDYKHTCLIELFLSEEMEYFGYRENCNKKNILVYGSYGKEVIAYKFPILKRLWGWLLKHNMFRRYF